MNICSEDHEEVCYEGRECPCCEIIKDKDQAISDLEDEVTDLKSQVAALESDLEDKE